MSVGDEAALTACCTTETQAGQCARGSRKAQAMLQPTSRGQQQAGGTTPPRGTLQALVAQQDPARANWRDGRALHTAAAVTYSGRGWTPRSSRALYSSAATLTTTLLLAHSSLRVECGLAPCQTTLVDLWLTRSGARGRPARAEDAPTSAPPLPRALPLPAAAGCRGARHVHRGRLTAIFWGATPRCGAAR